MFSFSVLLALFILPAGIIGLAVVLYFSFVEEGEGSGNRSAGGEVEDSVRGEVEERPEAEGRPNG
jgi:hypothetical protein